MVGDIHVYKFNKGSNYRKEKKGKAKERKMKRKKKGQRNDQLACEMQV